MRGITNLIMFAMAVYVMLDVYTTAPSGLASNAPVQAQYMLASR